MNVFELVGKKVIDIQKDNVDSQNEGLRIVFEDGYVLRIGKMDNCVELLKKDI